MATFNELMQKYVNTDYPVLLDLAKEAIRTAGVYKLTSGDE